MIDTLKFGTYIFFAFFAGAGGVFVWLLCPGKPIFWCLQASPVLTENTETKNKTLEELDVYFGGSMNSIAARDKARMESIYERIGLSGIETVEELGERKASRSYVEEEEPEVKA